MSIKYIPSVSLLISLFLSLVIVASAQSGIIDNNGFEYDYTGGGIYQISSEKGSTYLGFAISGNYNGNGFLRSFNNFTWNSPVETSPDIWTITESTGNWETEFSFVDDTKISNTVTNPYPLPITNAKFYYILSTDPDDKIRVGNKVFTVNEDSDYHFTDAQYNLNEIVPNLVVNNIQMNYEDLLDNGFDITDLYLTDGDMIGYPGQKIIAVGFTKGTRTINPGQTVVVDPIIEKGFVGYTTFVGNNAIGNGTVDFNIVDSDKVDIEITNYQAGFTATINATNDTADFTNIKKIHINSSTDGALTDYQIKINVDYESEMQTNFDDIRFNELNGSYINYWIESINASNSSVMWIKTNVPAAGGKDISMYYTNSTITNNSDGYNVFEKYANVVADWSTDHTIPTTIGDRVRLFDNSPLTIFWSIDTEYDDDSVFEMKYYSVDLGDDSYHYLRTAMSDDISNRYTTGSMHDGSNYRRELPTIDEYWSSAPFDTELKHVQIVKKGDTTVDYYMYQDDVLQGSSVNSSYALGSPVNIEKVIFWAGSNNAFCDVRIDYAFIRKHTNNVPTYSIGSEINLGDINITVSVIGDTNTSTYTISETKTVILTPTAPISQIVFNTTSTDYSYNATVYWVQNTTIINEVATSGVYNQTVKLIPDENVTSGYINTTVNHAIFNISEQLFVSQKYAYENDSTDVTSNLAVPSEPWSHFNLSVFNLNVSEGYEWWFVYNYNNAPIVGAIANITTNISESTQFTAPSFSDQEGLGINSEIWYFGDGDDSTDHNPKHTYTSTGVYYGNYSVTENATVSPQTITRDFTVFVYDRNITCVLESRTPGNLTLNSRGTISLVYNCSCGDGINADNIFITGSVEGNLTSGLPNRWSARPPPNNKTVSSGYVNDSILRAHGRNKGFWFEGLGLFNDTFSYAVFDKNSPHVTITNYSDYAIINMTWDVPQAAFRNQIYIEQTNQTDDGDYEVYDSNGLLTTIWDISAYRDDQNYTILDEYSISYNGNPDASLVMYYCNDTHSIIADPLPNGIDMTDNTLLYHLDETAGAIVDSSGTNNNGTYTGTEYNQIGKVDTSIGFDGNDEIGFATDTSLYGENVTVSAWIYWEAESGTVDPIVSQTNPAGWGYRLYIDTVTDRAVFWLDNTGVSSSNIIPKNKWVHIVGTHNESELRIYVNTVDEVLAKTGSGKNFVGYVGYDSVGEYFNGRIDEVAIWGRTLNDSEVDHIFHMGAPSPDIDDHNAAYIGAFDTSDIVNGKIHATIPVVNGTISNVMVTNTSYRYIISDCSYSSGQWIVDYSNNKTFINVSFADSNVSLSTIDDGGNFAYTEFTPIVSSYSVVPLDTYYSGIYVENTFGDSYTNLSFVSDLIDDVNLNISNPSITTVGSDFGGEDNPNDGTILTHAGSSYIRVNMAADPDAQASVNHTLYMLYQNETIYQTINNSFYSSASFVDIDLTTCIYASDTYRLRVDSVADDNPSDTKTFTTGNFTILGNTPATAYNGNLLGFVGATDIPTLHSLINNDSYMSYDIGSNTYTMHVTHYQVCYNDVFNFSSKVYLRSENSSDKTINYNWNGCTDFTSAEITAWDITENAAAPSTDVYRSALISCATASGNITNTSFYNLGSDVIDRDGLILIDFDNINIINNTFVYCHHPIVIKDDSDNNIIENNRLLNSYGNGMLISTYSDYNYVANNTIDISGSRGIYLYYSSHNILYNNSVQNCDSYDYYFRVQCVNNTLIDPYDEVNEIRPTSSSDGSIVNTDYQAFSHTSQYFQTTAHISNFSMGYGGVSETFNITQRDMYITPINDSIIIENLNWTTAVSLNATSNTSLNPVWFNITHEMWNYETVEVFRNGSLYDTTPATDDVVAYNYVGGFSEWYFRFTPHEYFISGYVTDFSNTSITDVFVSDNRSIDSTTTNASGYYSLYGYINGSHTLIATKEGYYPGTLEVGVSGADLLNQNIILTQILEVLENMTWHIFILLAVICVMLIWYSFTRTDISYYTDVITSILAVVLSALLAYDSIIGIGYYFATDTSVQSLVYQSVPLAIIFGSVTLMMVIFTIVKILELVHQEVEEI